MNVHSMSKASTSSLFSINNENESTSSLGIVVGLPEKKSTPPREMVMDMSKKEIGTDIKVPSFNISSASMTKGLMSNKESSNWVKDVDENLNKKSKAIFNIKFNAKSFEYPD